MLYLTHIDNYYAEKNKLQAAISALAKTLDRHLIEDVDGFVCTCEKEVKALNQIHKRCTPEMVYLSPPNAPLWSQSGIYNADGSVQVGQVKINLREVKVDNRPEFIAAVAPTVKVKGKTRSVDPMQLNLFWDA